jgi:hypothetical protein
VNLPSKGLHSSKNVGAPVRCSVSIRSARRKRCADVDLHLEGRICDSVQSPFQDRSADKQFPIWCEPVDDDSVGFERCGSPKLFWLQMLHFADGLAGCQGRNSQLAPALVLISVREIILEMLLVPTLHLPCGC